MPKASEPGKNLWKIQKNNRETISSSEHKPWDSPSVQFWAIIDWSYGKNPI